MFDKPTLSTGISWESLFSCADLRYNIEYKFERKAV